MRADVNVVLAAQGHQHANLDLGVDLGPLALRVVLLAAVAVVAGFALLRGFLAEPGRRTTVAVGIAACAAATLELLLSGGLNLPDQTVPLLLAALAAPLYLIQSRDERFVPAVRLARRFAPWVFWPVAVLAAGQLGAAWLGSAGPGRTATLLHTGVLLGVVATAWFAVARPRATGPTIGLRVGAALLAVGLLGGVAKAAVLRPAEPVPGVATTARVDLGGETVDALVVPNLPGWNLVHVSVADAAVGTDATALAPARARQDGPGGWAAVELPAGRSRLWVGRGSVLGSFTTDTGSGGTAPPGLFGADGPECVSMLLGAMLAAGPVTSGTRCPSDTMDSRDTEALRETVDLLARQGYRRIAVYADRSPRGRAAAETVRSAAADRRMAVVRLGDGRTPLVVVSGWVAAESVLRQVARGGLTTPATHLAPWLRTERLLAIDAGQRIAQRLDPEGESFRRYTTELRRGYPTQPPSASGHRSWLAERLGPRPEPPLRIWGDARPTGRAGH